MQTRFFLLAITLAGMLLSAKATEEEVFKEPDKGSDKGSLLGRLLSQAVDRLEKVKRFLHDELHHSLESHPVDSRWAAVIKLLADVNTDGKLSVDELSTFLSKVNKRVTPELLTEHDLDGDGFLDDGEIVQAMKALYS